MIPGGVLVNLRDIIKERVLILDGAYGTEFYRRGYKGEVPVDVLNIENPQMVLQLQREYVEAGADLLLTNTFNSNPLKMRRFGFSASDVEKLIKTGVKNAQRASAGKSFVLGDIGPTGEFLEPVGRATYGEIYDAFLFQAKVLIESGVDGIILETFSDILELKIAARAVRQVSSDIFLIAHLTFDEQGRTLTGSDPAVLAVVFQDLPVDALGINCQLVPEKLLPVFQELARQTKKFLVVEPEGGSKGFIVSPEEFASFAESFWEVGANVIGGCCGTTPEHIRALKLHLGERRPIAGEQETSSAIAVAGVQNVLVLSHPLSIGERFNPSGKKRLRKAIEEQDVKYSLELLRKQLDAGADLLDVNFGVEQLVNPEFAQRVVLRASYELGAVLSIDVQGKELLEKLLKVYPGRAIVNSTTAKGEDLTTKAELVKEYGGLLVLLPMRDKIPKSSKERLKIALDALRKLKFVGIERSRIILDPLVLPLGAGNDPMITLNTLELFKKEGLWTTAGVSNVSFGLPNRSGTNAAFLAMAMLKGLDLPIIDVLDENVLSIFEASKMILYGVSSKYKLRSLESDNRLAELMIKGRESEVSEIVKKALQKMEPLEVVDKLLRPAMETIGQLYEDRKIYLPHLLLAAQIAKKAFALPLSMLEDSKESGTTFVIATVKGDIHDIGKGIVAAVVRGSGYRVVDLGVDVPSEKIVETVEKEKPLALGLSAMMTTTIGRIGEVISLLKEKKIVVPVLAGGASVNEKVAAKMGVDHYCRNASDAVKVLASLRNKIQE
ncbi:MAG: 5-methyltetrahydrofolate--homocysteine methyltransferase [Thermotogae bacterium]|nr:MAG: 5-methyltetrahydrofolate--homocysteine methyltransferase [Thermotogota bacterium]